MVQDVIPAGHRPAERSSGHGPTVTRHGIRPWPGRGVGWAAAGVLLAAGTYWGLSNGEAAATVRGAVAALADAHWAVVPVLVLLVAVHFWLAAVALGGAAGQRLPPLQATMAQFTAATANRITGGGLGTVAVNARYLAGRGVPASRALALAGMLQIGGALADLALFAVVTPIAVGTGGGVLSAQVGEWLRGKAGPFLAVAAVAVACGAVAAWALRGRLGEWLRGPLAAGTQLLRRPRDLAVMLVASAATTLVMGVAFALSVLAVPGTASWSRFSTLIVVYMIGAAVGGAVPGPGGLGSTEAALVALLAATGVETAGAMSGVLIFRAVTHWAPVPIGLLTVAAVGGRGS